MRLLLLVPVIVIATTTLATAQSIGIQRVAWLRGCWDVSTPTRSVEEHWLAPRAGSMLGVGRTVVGGKLVEYELVLIREDGNGLAYDAKPSSQSAATFLSRTVSDTEVVFENLQHDFPQRVGYRRSGTDALLAWIEGTQQGQLRRIEFPYRRAACDGS